MGGQIHQATIGNLRELLHNGKPVVVDFWANWCAPCHAMAPILRGLADDYSDKVIFAKVNVEQNRDLADQFRIKSIPTLVFFKKGKEWDRVSGVRGRDELKKIIEKISG